MQVVEQQPLEMLLLAGRQDQRHVCVDRRLGERAGIARDFVKWRGDGKLHGFELMVINSIAALSGVNRFFIEVLPRLTNLFPTRARARPRVEIAANVAIALIV